MKLLIDIGILACLVGLTGYAIHVESMGLGALSVAFWFLAFISYFDDSGSS
jgi:hypothetical protein